MSQLLLGGAGSPRAALRRGLGGAWDFSSSGNLGLDSVGTTNLTNMNAVTQAAGLFASAAQFMRANNKYLTAADNAQMSTGDIDFALAAWVYLDSKPTQMCIAGKSAGGAAATIEYHLDYLLSTDRFRFSVSDGLATKIVSATTFGAPALATWYLLLGYHDSVSNQIGIAVNTVLNTTAHSAGVQDGAGAFEIGRSLNSSALCFDGRIGPVWFWKRLLTRPEQYWLYNGGRGLAL